MAGFGEEIGDAYIDVHASTRPFRREIKREARRAGQEAGSSFDDGFQSELKDSFTSIGKDQERRLKKSGFNSGRIFGDAMGRGVKAKLARFNVDLADAISTGDFDKVIKQFDTLDQAVEAVDKKFTSLRRGQRLSKKEFESARASFKAYTDEIRRNTAWTDMVEEAVRADKRWTKEREKEARKRSKVIDAEVAHTKKAAKEEADARTRSLTEIADAILLTAERANKAHVTEMKRIKEATAARNKAHEAALKESKARSAAREDEFKKEIKGWADSTRAFRSFERSVNNGMRYMDRQQRRRRRELVVGGATKDDIAAFDRAYTEMRTSLDKTTRTVEKSQRGFIGRLRGSRNNFLHFIGGIGGAFERFVGRGIDKALDVVGGGISKVGDMLSKNDGLIGKFGDKLGGLGEMVSGLGGKGGFLGLAVSLGVSFVAIQALIPALGILVSLASGLLGIIAALASTVTIGLGGAIGSILPIVGALVIALGGLALAYYDTEGDYKDLLAAIDPLIQTGKEVRTRLQEAFGPGMQRLAERFAGVLERMEPLFIVMGNSVIDFIDSFGALIQSPEMSKLLDLMAETFPGIIRELGELFNATFLAIAAIMTAAAPVVEDFLGIMGDAVLEWANWAASAEGQTQIREWFETAAEAAQILWDVVSGIGSVLAAIFDAGLEDGNNLWSTLGDKLREFAEWLRTDEGQEKLKEWYDRAMELATALGDVAVAVGDLVIELDDFLSSQTLQTVLDLVGQLFGALEWLAIKFEQTTIAIATFAANAKTKMGEIGTAWQVATMLIEQNVFNPIKAGLSGVQITLSQFVLGVGLLWAGFRTTLFVGWTWINQNVFTPLKTGVGAIATAFGLAVTAVREAWSRLKAAVAEPVNAVIRIYRDNIKAPFEKVADAVGLKWRLPTIPEVKFASGGVLPGYTPGRDIHNFVSPTGGRLALSGGEAIMRPEWTRAVGGPKAVARMNRMARRGQAFASGGVFGRAAIAGDSGDGGGIAGSISRLLSAGKIALGELGDLLSNPAESLKKIILAPLEAALSGLPGAQFGRLMGGIVTDLAKEMVGAFVKGTKEANISAGPGAGAASGPIPGGWATMFALVKRVFPWATLNSGFRPGAITATGYPSMHGKGRAIDLPPSREIFNWLRTTFPGAYELIFSPMGAAQLYKGRPYVFPEPTRRMHFNHIHWAMANGGVWNPSGVPSAGVFTTSAAASVNAPTSVASPAGSGLPVTATGGLFGQAQARVIAEAGREAVVPLDRPLSQVDPAVRGLAAYAQGKRNETKITVISPHADPYHVALDTVDELARRGME